MDNPTLRLLTSGAISGLTLLSVILTLYWVRYHRGYLWIITPAGTVMAHLVVYQCVDMLDGLGVLAIHLADWSAALRLHMTAVFLIYLAIMPGSPVILWLTRIELWWGRNPALRKTLTRIIHRWRYARNSSSK